MVRHTGKDLIDVESDTVASMLSFQSSGVKSAELDAPEADRFQSDDDTALGQDIFNVSVTQIEAIVEPDSVADEIWRKTMSLVGIHWQILPIWPS